MKIIDAGVKESSFMDFTIPTEFAKRTLYYMPQYGHFLCDSLYRIERETLEWFLLIYIRSGTLYLESENVHYTAPAGSVVFLDCRYPHCYFCKDTVDFLWFHFLGNNAETYAELLGQPRCAVFPKKRMETLFKQIFARAQGIPCNEHLISADIHRLLGKLAWSGNSVFSVEPLAPALEYIRNHFDMPIQLQQLAEMCNISASHFIRLFQQSLEQERQAAEQERQAEEQKRMADEQERQAAEQKRQAQEQEQHAEALKTVDQKLEDIRDVVVTRPETWRKDCLHLVAAIAQKRGGDSKAYQDTNIEIFNLVDQRAHVSLQTRLTNRLNRMKAEGVGKSKQKKLNKIDIIAEDNKLIEIYIAIVKEMCIQYEISPSVLEEAQSA